MILIEMLRSGGQNHELALILSGFWYNLKVT